MKIEKMPNHVGWWVVSQTLPNGVTLFATSDNKLDALNRMFDKLKWNEIK